MVAQFYARPNRSNAAAMRTNLRLCAGQAPVTTCVRLREKLPDLRHRCVSSRPVELVEPSGYAPASRAQRSVGLAPWPSARVPTRRNARPSAPARRSSSAAPLDLRTRSSRAFSRAAWRACRSRVVGMSWPLEVVYPVRAVAKLCAPAGVAHGGRGCRRGERRTIAFATKGRLPLPNEAEGWKRAGRGARGLESTTAGMALTCSRASSFGIRKTCSSATWSGSHVAASGCAGRAGRPSSSLASIRTTQEVMSSLLDAGRLRARDAHARTRLPRTGGGHARARGLQR